MKRILLLGILAVLIVGVAHAVRPSSQINYQGVLRDASDKPLDGTYNMVFRFFSADVGGDEILVDTHSAVTVTDGLFSVRLGGISIVADGVVTDGSGPGYFAYLPAVFGAYSGVYLEVQIDGETLSPRTRIVSAASALNARYVNGVNVAADGPLDLYVDAVTGNDSNNGFFPDSAKQSIQAALDRIPAILTGQVTVYIADGTYRESLFLPNHVLKEPYFVFLVGNEAFPQNVVLDGEGFREQGLLTLGLTSVSGMEITGFVEEGLEVDFGALWVDSCRIIGNGSAPGWGSGIGVYEASAEVSNTLIANNFHIGIQVSEGASSLEVVNTQIINNGTDGIQVADTGDVEIGEQVTIQGNGGIGIHAIDGSCVGLGGETTVTVQSNTGGDMRSSYHSTIRGYGNGTTGTCVEADAHSMCEP